MANPKILEAKQNVIDEITNNVKESSSFILLDNNGLTVSESMELRRALKNSVVFIFSYSEIKNSLLTLTLIESQCKASPIS